MQSVVQFDECGGPEVLRVVEAERPDPGPGEIVVRNRFAGVNFIDTYFRSGVYPGALPGRLGQEAAGEVAAVGAGVGGLAVGDAVAYLGSQNTYAQYTAVAAARAVRLDPQRIPLDVGAAMLLQGLTAHALVTRAHAVQRGEWVLVQAGAGGTGRLLVQLCARLGAHVIATASTPEKAAVARRAGAEHVLGYDGLAEAVRRIVPDGVHAVFDGVGAATFAAGLDALRREGSMVSFGNASGVVPPVRLLDLAPKNLRLLRPSLYGYLVTDADYQRHLPALVDLVQDGALDISVSAVYPLEDAGRAHADLQARRTTGKLLLRIP
ncbi:hypothetical protein H4R18_002663 [Coemansia javaensis]|uniref:Enoyl reductase (ER) domain-containing protein n=1 Tax=Coemansia javaensis TaxID=2761396 RepID=A0A9W8HBH0_9FUNG|nr:hypothetical protein H4R18_002663 [Coemansia javaensis]